MKRLLKPLIAALLLTATAFAVTVTGTVKNNTTGKPSAGDNVDLLALQQGMTVQASTKTDSKGSFSFQLDDTNSPHLVRVTHDGVNFFPPGGPIRPGVTTVDVEVCDAGSEVEGISTNVNVVRLQTEGNNLQVMELIAVKNASSPPRALKRDKTYEFYLPENAQIDQVMVQAPGGMPVSSAATPEGKSGKYSFNYALKPGETRFEIAYHLPYSGEANFTPKMTDDVQHFVVMMPKTMTFEARNGAKFSPMDDKTSNVQVSTNANASSNLAFKVSGTGVLQEDQQPGGQSAAGTQPSGSGQQSPDAGDQGGGMPTADNRPGGGLGAPIDAPDPLHSYRWVLLGGLGIVLVCGATFVISRSNQQLAEAADSAPVVSPPAPTGGRKKPAPPAVTEPAAPVQKAQPQAQPQTQPQTQPPSQPEVKGSMLLEGLKEELFQLEVEKEQGKISAEEYETTKAALNQTLRRALQRKPS